MPFVIPGGANAETRDLLAAASSSTARSLPWCRLRPLCELSTRPCWSMGLG